MNEDERLREKSLQIISSEFKRLEIIYSGDSFTQNRASALFGKFTFAAELGTITFAEWESYLNRLRRIHDSEA